MDSGTGNDPTPLETVRCPFFNQAKGDIEELSALDSKFCQDVHFPLYHPAPKIQPEMDPCVWQNWIESLTMIQKNLSWVLKQPHMKFWCQIVNNLSLQAFLDSYLKQTPRFQGFSWPDDVLEVHNDVHRLVFMVYIRMATNKESVKHFMTTDFFGELIYENFLFDTPKIMDLCAVYGNQTNSPLLRKALSNVFKCQPNYNEDLKQSAETIMQIFHNIDEKCGVLYSAHDSNDEASSNRRPHRLSEGPINGRELMDLPHEEFQDIIMYTSDISFTLQRFLVDVYPTACTVFREKAKYLAHFYSTSLSVLKGAVGDRPIDDLHMRSQLFAHLKMARMSILNVVRGITNECMVRPALRASEVGDHAGAENAADEFFQVLSDLLGEQRFFHDFLRKLPIMQDVQSLLQGCPGIDETRASFILGSLGAGMTGTPRFKSRNVLVNGTKEIEQTTTTGSSSHSASQQHPAKSRVADGELQSLIRKVRDVLPHLDEGFIQSCLKYFDRDCEKTIHALLEGNIPDNLRVIDNTAERQEMLSKSDGPILDFNSVDRRTRSPSPETAMLQERRNVFDKDEFDIYQSSNVDFSRIHKGKKSKSTLGPAPTSEMKQIYEKYSMVYDEEEITEGFGSSVADDSNIYDDEYDDMYDGLRMDANDADDTDEILSRRPFVTPRIFLQQRKERSPEAKSEEEQSTGPKPDHFIANPAELREKREERWRQLQELRSNKRGGNRTQKPEGSSNVTQDRKRKDANKAKVGNHNRKKMASRKAAKGMAMGPG